MAGVLIFLFFFFCLQVLLIYPFCFLFSPPCLLLTPITLTVVPSFTPFGLNMSTEEFFFFLI